MNIMFEGSFDGLKKTETRVMEWSDDWPGCWGHPSKLIVDITHADGSVKHFSQHFSFQHFVFREWSTNSKKNFTLDNIKEVEIYSTRTYEQAVERYAHCNGGGLHSFVSAVNEDGWCHPFTYLDGHSNDHGTIQSLRIYKKGAQIDEINRSTKPFLHQDIVNIVTSYFA